jgi:hypothetical protein
VGRLGIEEERAAVVVRQNGNEGDRFGSDGGVL